MDELARFLDGPRARGAFLLQALLDPPWSLRILDEAPLTLVAVTAGRARLLPDDGEAVDLVPGDGALCRGPDHYTMADPPDTAPQVVIHPGQRCSSDRGEDLRSSRDLGVRTWGTGGGSTALLVGTYEEADEINRSLLDALPPVVVVRGHSWDSPLVDLLAREMTRDDPGQAVVLDRLLDLLVVATLRAHFADAGVAAPAWYRAQGDPVVGPVLRLMRDDPAHPWTVAALAREAGVSRAALARRFADVVGEPPMAWLTGWRLALAADRLVEPGITLGAVAREVGYGSAFALSAAFKRVRGVSPADHRQKKS